CGVWGVGEETTWRNLWVRCSARGKGDCLSGGRLAFAGGQRPTAPTKTCFPYTPHPTPYTRSWSAHHNKHLEFDAICASLRQRQGRTQQRFAIA
ncbi:MAG: hypothetical protein AB1589_36480, partial [Cyanobacteriota bacterium]